MIENPLVWIDCEMTGLDVVNDKLLEISVVVTDSELTQQFIGPNIVIHQPEDILSNMGEWCTKHHLESGLTAKVRESKISVREAEKEVLDFVKKYIKKSKVALLAGNSVHMDRCFLLRDMPELIDYLHYRVLDVSVLKELTKRWLPKVSEKAPKKKLTHRAEDDILESIAELRFYKDNIFMKN